VSLGNNAHFIDKICEKILTRGKAILIIKRQITERRLFMRKVLLFALLMFLLLFSFSEVTTSHAEYADKVLDNYASSVGMRPVVFPHWTHRIRVTCKVCHQDLGFKLMKGSNDITMSKIVEGKFCGACHNGEVAWPAFYCDRCHSGLMPSGKPMIPNPDKSLTTPEETANFTVKPIGGGGMQP
jgi:c(7)-type cytochrome triheme protein